MDVKEVPKSKYLPQSIDAILETFAIIYDGLTRTFLREIPSNKFYPFANVSYVFEAFHPAQIPTFAIRQRVQAAGMRTGMLVY